LINLLPLAIVINMNKENSNLGDRCISGAALDSCGDRKGTSAGYARHRRAGESSCEECREACRNYSAQWYKKNAARPARSVPVLSSSEYHRQYRQRQVTNDHPGIYLIEFSDGVLKVGSSRSQVNLRVGRHAEEAGQQGMTVIHQVVARIDGNEDIIKVEDHLLDWCSTRASEVRGREYFAGVAFEQAARLLVLLARDPSIPLDPVENEDSSYGDRRGSLAGYERHRRSKATPCVECRRANREKNRRYYAVYKDKMSLSSSLSRQELNDKDESGVYVVLFSNGSIKIGKSTRIRGRISEHEKDARKWSLKILKTYSIIVEEKSSEFEKN
jgi:predicted GIY-YIG superfamily endonuclease